MFTFAGGADDEGIDGPLHSPWEDSWSSDGEGWGCEDKAKQTYCLEGGVDQKVDLTRKSLGESENQAEVLKKVLKDKEGEISSLRKQGCQDKEDERTEFCNSDDFLVELGDCYADCFNECLR